MGATSDAVARDAANGVTWWQGHRRLLQGPPHPTSSAISKATGADSLCHSPWETAIMSASRNCNLHHDHVSSRRTFVKTSTAAAGALLCGWSARPELAAAQEPPAALTKEARDKLTADQILAKWKEGN